MKIYEGYTVMTLKRLGYSDKNIKDFLIEIEELMKIKTDEDAIEIMETIKSINTVPDNDTNQVIFEGINIPVEYNNEKISDLFEQYGFMGKEYKYKGKKVSRALSKGGIIYIKDLYKKTKKDIMYIHVIGEASYNFFIYALQQIFCKNNK